MSGGRFAPAADLLGDGIDQFAGLVTLPVVSAVTPAIRLTLSPSTAASTLMAAVLRLILQLVHGLAQRGDVGAFEHRPSTLMP